MLLNRHSYSFEPFNILGRANHLLPAVALEQIRSYISSRLTAHGGFANRKGEADLYYTVFGLVCAVILDIDLSTDKLEEFVGEFNPEQLSMVDLCCYVKCRAVLNFINGENFDNTIVDKCLNSIKKFHTPNGSFSYDGKGSGFPYAQFLALNFYQDLGIDLPSKEKFFKSLDNYRTEQGAFCNPDSGDEPMLLSTVAAIHVIRYLTGEVDALAMQWLTGQYRNVGGFCAAVNSQLPDMLSTAVAVFTLSICGYPLDAWQDTIHQFIDDHWDDCGGFRATILDDTCDCEYTYYGLLALGSIQ